VRPLRTLIAALALAVAGIVTLTATPDAVAAASDYQRVLQVYERAGSIPPCTFSSPELEDALKGVDSYGAQYFADFTQAIQDALSARAAGACSPPPQVSAAAAGKSGPGVGIPAHLGPLTAATNSGVPAPLALLGVLAVLGVLAGGTAWALRTRGRHARPGGENESESESETHSDSHQRGSQPAARTPTERL